MSKRPPWPRRMLQLAELWAGYSTCKRRQVGAVLYDPETWAILGIGYNDTPIGEKDCGDGGCTACIEGSVRDRTDCNCVHAEMNAILLSRADVRGSHLAVWNIKEGWPVTKTSLCARCRGARVQAGIRAVLVGNDSDYEFVRDPNA